VRAPRADAPAAPAPRPPDLLRTLALAGPSGAGQTTLLEGLLCAAGAVQRAGRVEDGTTVSDSDDVEKRRQHSVALSVAQLEHDGVKLTLLDTPGAPDFVGELRAGLRAADAVLFVVSAAAGPDAATAQLWAECARAGLPRAVAVTQLDKPRADVDQVLAACRELLDEAVVPLHLPLRDDAGAVTGLVDLLHEQVVPPGATGEDADDEVRRAVAASRAELVEAVIAESEDETLLDRYLGGEPVDPAVLTTDLETAVARGHFHPALLVAPLTGLGLPQLLDLLVAGFPSPR
jgi:elongation factor G